jgi:tetratricopeptide (TPR) repeat protein
MTRRVFVPFLILGLVAVGIGGYFAWGGYAARSNWREIRPSQPEAAGAAAPGLDARLAGCLAKLDGWPPDRAALAEFSQLCQANGLLPEAIQGYRALMTVDPAEGRWPHLLALILSGLGRLDEALPLLQKVTELAPQQTIGWLRLGDTQLKINHLAEAESAYQEVLKCTPGDVYALFGLGRCDLQAGRLTAARSRLQQAVASNPDFPGAQTLLAMVFDQLGNAAAAEFARHQVKNDGRYTAAPDPWELDLVTYCHIPYTLLTAASAELSDGLPKKSLPLLHRAIQLAPEDARLHRQLGNTLMLLGDQPGARAELERALALAPKDEKIRTDLIKILRDAKAAARLEQVVLEGVTTNPDSAGLNYEAGLIAVRAGRTDEAIRCFALVWKLRPEETTAPCELAAAYFGQGRAAEGMAVLETVLKTHPNSQTVLTQLVRQGIAAGDPRAAVWLGSLEAQAAPSPLLSELRQSYHRRFGAAP